MNITEIQALLLSGGMGREECWHLLQTRHLQLREYHQILDDSLVKQIEINKHHLIIETFMGSKFIWNPEDLRSPANWLVNYKVQDSDGELLLAVAKNRSVIFDVGANIGYYTVNCAKLNPNTQIHAFEPVPSTFEQLQNNVHINQLDGQVRLNNFALGTGPSQDKIYYPKFSGSAAASLQQLHPEEDQEIIPIEISTLDKYVSDNHIQHLDFIKIDVEGAELLVLKGGLNTISKYKPIIFIELLRKWSKEFGYKPNDVLELLFDFGYQCWTLEGNRMCQIQDINDNTSQTNFLMVQPERDGNPNQIINH